MPTRPIVKTQRSLYLEAPEGEAIYASASYARAPGEAMLEVVRHEIMAVRSDGERFYDAKRMYLRGSEDNGETWREEDSELLHGGDNATPPAIILDPFHDLLIALSCTWEVDPDDAFMAIGSRAQRTRRAFYQLSDDGGLSWTSPRNIIDSRPGYDLTNWAPGVAYGVAGGIASGQPAFLSDGTLVVGFVVTHPEAPASDQTARALELYSSICYGRATFNRDAFALDWEFGETVHVDFPMAGGGCCEPAVVSLGGQRLFNTMRCQGDEEHGIHSTRYCTMSDDGGMSWTEPEPLRYDDGETVWTPASVHLFFRSNKTGQTYLLANILPAPVYGQRPRYPLAIAVFDTDSQRVRRDSVTVIQDLPDGAPVERRYTNWGMYEDRRSGDLVMTMPEQPKFVNFTDMTRAEEFTADCIQFRLRFGT